jgi:hypothetical protein
VSETHTSPGWERLNRTERTDWLTLDTLPPAIREKLQSRENLPAEIRSYFAMSEYPAFGYHIGSVPPEKNAPYLLVPSADKGYGYGVFFNPEGVALRFTGGKRYRRKPEHLPVLIVPIDNLCFFKYSPRGDLVGCTNGRGVYFDAMQVLSWSFAEASQRLNLDSQELDVLLQNYQRRARDFQVCWPNQYQLVDIEADEAEAIREGHLSMGDAIAYIEDRL